MLKKRIIPCLDVKDGKVVKGKQFVGHEVVGDIFELAEYYCKSGADELVFYDIEASCTQKIVNREWINRVAERINIPFCVAGGIRTIHDAEIILNAGADKISINSPALENPELINELAEIYGKQCIVIGIDSLYANGFYTVQQYTGSVTTIHNTKRQTFDWIREVQERGAGEIVLNCMNQDGMKQGYDIDQLKEMRSAIRVPLIASGGAGCSNDFLSVFRDACVDGALAAGVFHRKEIHMMELKFFLARHNIEVRL